MAEKKKGCGCLSLFTIAFGLVVLIAVFGQRRDQPPPGRAGPEAGANTGQKPKLASVVFDIPSLIGKSIDEIREIVGKPQDKEPEPTMLQLQIGIDEWSNVFTKDGEELLVTFNPRTRQVIDFFLGGEGKTLLMQQGNLADGTPAYRIEPVKQIRNPSKITGIKIVPTRGN